MEEMHQQEVTQMIKSAEGSSELLHKITKLTARRGGAQILKKEEEEDARLLDRCEAKWKEWAKHWQYDELGGKALEKRRIEDIVEALPRPQECGMEHVSRLYKAKTGVGCDGFHPKVHLDVTKETR